MTHEEELRKIVKEKIAELNFAEYQGDIRCFAAIVITKAGDVQIISAYDSINSPHIYLTAGMLQRQIEAVYTKGAMEVKPRE